MKIVITQEDCRNAPYVQANDCPIARALNKALGIRVSFFISSVSNIETGKKIGFIEPVFTARVYKELKNGAITEFVTEYTPNT